MGTADWIVMGLFFLLMVGIGVWSSRQIEGTSDFFTAGGKMPWWLSGISHHMSGYSAAVFVAYAEVAYRYGFTIYVWWAIPISISCFIGAIYIAPRWARLRMRLGIESPMEYLAIRYNVPTQQLMAWTGTFLKIFDVGAKWASIAVILNVFAGIPPTWGILISGVISMFYITVGGLWADALTDFAQFVVQLLAGFSMLYIVMTKLGGPSSIFGIWDRLPPDHANWLNGPYNEAFIAAYLLITFLSYNGGTWNLAQRYIASPTGSDARKAGLLSAALYLIWPLILFFPMWAAPILYPDLKDASQSYSKMAMELLPPGLVGLVLASMFAHTMAMTTSDANAITAVVTRDILPVIWKGFRNLSKQAALKAARITTLTFMVLTWIIAIKASSFGGILSLLVLWFGALVGPISIAMLLGLLPAFRHSDATAANSALISGLLAFAYVKYGVVKASMAMTVGVPVLVSALVFIGIGLMKSGRPPRKEVVELLDSINTDDAPSAKNDHNTKA
jgi:SSS family solute:Na+ symporter